MDALLLALLLGLALDQGDRSQRLVRSLEAGALLPVCVIIIAGALVSAGLGLAVAPFLQGPAGLLFFAIALALAAVGLSMPKRTDLAAFETGKGRLTLYLQLSMHRLGDRSAFMLAAVAAMTGNSWGAAIGGIMGGMGALIPPLLAGAAYEKIGALRIIRPALGVLLLLVALGCAVSALGLL